METIQIELAAEPFILAILLLQTLALVWFVKNHIRLTRARDYWKLHHRREWYKNNLRKEDKS